MSVRPITRILPIFVIAVTGLAVPVATASAEPPRKGEGASLHEGFTSVNPTADPPVSTTPVVVPMAFPVVGSVSWSNTFLVCRGSGCSRRHLGQDLMSAKMSPLVAAFSGTVTYLKRESYVGEGNYVSIQSADRVWTVNYIHVNNDVPGTDDGRGTGRYAFLPGLAVGSPVTRGQLVGWVGDSGNAEGTGPHVHFELRKGNAWSGTVFNPYHSLRSALRLSAPLTAAPHQPGELIKWAGGPPFLLTSDGGRRAVPPSLMPVYAWRADDVVTVSGGEVMMYPYRGIAPLREGSIVRAPNGVLWAMAQGARYIVTEPQLAQWGLYAHLAIPVTDEVLGGVPAGNGLVPGGKYRSGALFHESGDPQVWLMDGGTRHPIHQGTFPVWGMPAGQIATLPVGTLDESGAPEVGSLMTFKYGTIYRTTTQGTFMLVRGIRRQITDSNAQTYYNWKSKRQFWLYESVNAMLPLGPPIA